MHEKLEIYENVLRAVMWIKHHQMSQNYTHIYIYTFTQQMIHLCLTNGC